jgi:hypothetical protein
MSSPSSVWRRYEPGLVTLATVKGPSHGELSLCSPSVFWIATEDEITNVEGVFLDVAIVVASNTLEVPC